MCGRVWSEEIAPLAVPGDSRGGALQLMNVPAVSAGESGSLSELARVSHKSPHHKSNEDRGFSRCSRAHGLTFQTFGVADGHHGSEASEHIYNKLPQAVNQLLMAGMDVLTSYTLAIRECEATFKASHGTSRAGSCAVSATVVGQYVVCANIGDCRCAVIKLAPRRKRAAGVVDSLHWMSVDHKVANIEERTRIEKLGGEISRGRVGGLVPTRCIGDFDVKDKLNPGVISINPDVRVLDLGEDSEAIVLCASDGVWDALSGKTLCSIVETHPSSSDVQGIAKRVVEYAIKKGSQDDCTVMCGYVSTESTAASSRSTSSMASGTSDWSIEKHRCTLSL
mmetsp:Transcript_647/g.1321  ORF Transcript_647/g.1321 Transcript_647/m.1321 type:complete len:337 (+) Transcript_647:88-1098(+)